MNFRIADTFTDSLRLLTTTEQKSAKTAAFDLQMNPDSPGLQLHRLENAKDKNFWSARVSKDIRIILHKTPSNTLLCYVAHHDEAYRWAERRKLEIHPTTGAMQMVELRERVEDIAPPPRAGAAPLLAGCSREQLLAYGVPPEWIDTALACTDEDALLALAERLPGEAGDALLALATGDAPPPLPQAAPKGADPFAHPDAQRRFRLMRDQLELERALEFPWDKWAVFLPPSQAALAERDFNGPARVTGTAGTGKTVVALHRAVHLARHNKEARVLLTTFSDTLAAALRHKMRCLVLTEKEPQLAERIEVNALSTVAQRLYERQLGARPRLAARDDIEAWLREGLQQAGVQFSFALAQGEWEDLVDAWQISTLDEYLAAKRTGMKTRLNKNQRTQLWGVFEALRARLEKEGLITPAAMFTQLAAAQAGRARPMFDFIIVDEAQDVSVAQLRFLAAVAGGRKNALFFAGDIGQRIFQPPFSWKAAGVDIRGRSRRLTVNYRTSHQIRQQADRLLDAEIVDADGETEARTGTVSVFNGPEPLVKLFASEAEETAAVAAWLQACMTEGVKPHEIAVFVRSAAQLARAKDAVQAAGLNDVVLDDAPPLAGAEAGAVSIATMHLAKGLEFRAVAVMACDDDVLPLAERVATAADSGELGEINDTERHLLYVACTRARDMLHVSGVAPGSEFLLDMEG